MIDFEEIEDLGYEDNTEESNTGFTIISDLQAEWALKKIKKATEERDRLVSLATKEIDELTKQIEGFNQNYKNSTGYLKMKLFEYFNKVEHKETNTRETYKLLSGSLVLKKASQKMVPDKDKLLTYLKENEMPMFVKVKEEVDWAGYKKECEIVDGKVVNVQTGDVLPDDVIAVEDVPGEFDVKI